MYSLLVLQWDVISCGNPVQEIAHISNGAHLGNCISIIRVILSPFFTIPWIIASDNDHLDWFLWIKQPSIPTENMLIVQETCIDTLGSLVVYAPVDMRAMNIALSGEDPSEIPILPSGFVISGDGRPETGSSGASTSRNTERSGGSLLTVAFQILISSPSSPKQLNMESVATVNTLISSTVQRIKAALNCSGLDWPVLLSCTWETISMVLYICFFCEYSCLKVNFVIWFFLFFEQLDMINLYKLMISSTGLHSEERYKRTEISHH